MVEDNTENGNQALDQETPDIQSMMNEEDAKELNERFENAKREHETVKEAATKNQESIKAVLQKYEDVMERGSQKESGEKRKKKENMLVVRNMTEEDWGRYGWNEEERNAVNQQLEAVLGIRKDEQKENAMAMLLTTGKTAQEVLALLNTEQFNAYKRDYKRRRLGEEVGENEEEVFLGGHESKAKEYFLTQKLGIGQGAGREHLEKYVNRFILTEEFHRELQQSYDQEMPANINELAWQINYEKPDTYGVKGRYPVLQLEMQRDKDGKITGAKYAVNQSNVIRWMRNQMMYYQEKDEDEITNYLSAVKLSKTLRSVDLNEIVDNPERYFTDEEGNKADYDGLYAQMLSEVIGMIHLRTHDLEYTQAMGQGEELAKKLMQVYYKSKLTKKSFGKSYFATITDTPLDYNGNESDDTIGTAFTTLYLAHYNLADFEELQKTLGKDSVFFTKKGMLDAIEEVYKKKYESSDRGVTKHELVTFIGQEYLDLLEKAFDDNGKVAGDGKDFVKFVNFYTQGLAHSHILQDVVKEGLFNALRERYDFHSKEQNIDANDKDKGKLIEDNDSLEMAWLMVHSMQRFTGIGAKNDTGAQGYDFTSKWMNTEAYRRKMATKKRGNGAGNPYTVPMFKSLLTDFTRAVRVSDAYAYVTDQFGKQVYERDKDTGKYKLDKDGNRIKDKRRKTIHDIFVELNEEKKEQKKGRVQIESPFKQAHKAYEAAMNRFNATKSKEDEDEMRRCADVLRVRFNELKKYDVAKAQSSRQIGNQLVFHENAMRDYAINHVDKARNVYDQVLGAKEVNFDKFTSFDAFRGVTFNREEFQKQLQQGLLHPIRYLFQNYGELNFNMQVRVNEFKGRTGDEDKYKFETRPLGEMMFGYQVLNIPKFRMCQTDKDGKETGRYLKDKKTGRYIIDYNKVQADKATAYKQWILMKLAGDMWTHMDRHSTDPSYNLSHYMNILDAVGSIPAGIDGDDSSLRKTRITEGYFSKEQMQWLRKVSGATNWRLYRRQVVEDLFTNHKDKESYFGDSLRLLFTGIFKGY